MRIKQLVCAAAAAAVALTVCGCSVKVGTNAAIKDDAVVAASTAENVEKTEITYLEFKKEYLYYLKGRGITDDSEESVAAACKTQRETIINYLINERILLNKAKEMGLESLTQEEMDEVEAEYGDLVTRQLAYFAGLTDFDPEADTLTAEQTETGNELFDEYLADCMLTRDDLLMWQVNGAIIQKVRDELVKDATVDRSEAVDIFNNYVESIRSLYESDKAQYETGMYSLYWVPEGSRRIKHVLLSFEDTFTDELREMRRNGDDEGADRLREEKAQEFSDTAAAISNMLDNGADIDDLIAEYSGDAAGSAANPDGYLLVPDSVSYMEEFTEAGQSLENIGDHCTALTDYGVHIVMYASDAAVSEDNINSYVDYTHELLNENAQSAFFNDSLRQWREEYGFNIDYEALKIDEPVDITTAESE